MKTPFNKQAVYRNEIKPLIDQIYAICQAHGIPWVSYLYIACLDQETDIVIESVVADTPRNPQSFVKIRQFIYNQQFQATEVPHEQQPIPESNNPASAGHPDILWDDEP